jgi:diguanylate cyclase (GGDEF)-like protein
LTLDRRKLSTVEASHLSQFLRLLRGSIKNEQELRRFVLTVTAVCVVIALAVDVTNQLAFFVDWATCFRSWGITTALVLVLAMPISQTIGKAHRELYRAKMAAETLSRTDQLTGLPNRRALIEAVETAKPEALALVIADIDRFKRVNDTYGHLAGDEVIRSVGQMMASEFGELGRVARVGGEEFALLSSGVSSEILEAKIVALRDRVAATPILVHGVAVRVTISAGVAQQHTGQTFNQLYATADRALYAAKAAGRNRVLLAEALGAFGERNYADWPAINSDRRSA